MSDVCARLINLDRREEKQGRTSTRHTLNKREAGRNKILVRSVGEKNTSQSKKAFEWRERVTDEIRGQGIMMFCWVIAYSTLNKM